MAHSKEKQIARLEAATRARRQGRSHAAGEVPRSAAERRDGHHRASACPRRYGGPPVFEDVTFDLGRGERLLVLGLNGAGKTSLLRILAGETTANLGDFSFGHNVNVGYYAQEHDNLRSRRNVARQHPRRGAHRRHPAPRRSCAACSA